MIIGILALQGAFLEHKVILEKLGVNTILLKKEEDIERCDGIIIPGGESTAMSIIENNIFSKLRECINKGYPVWGTCAGLVLLADEINGKIDNQKNIGGLGIKIERNYFGSQMNSFIEEIEYPEDFKMEGKFRAVFIRAPVILDVNTNTKILLKYKDIIVGVRKENLLGTSFHPELTNDYSWHKYFIDIVKRNIMKLKKE